MPPGVDEPEGWGAYRREILSALRRLEDDLGRLDAKLDTKLADHNTQLAIVRTEVELLKMKAGVWGLMGGLIPATGLLLAYLAREVLSP